MNPLLVELLDQDVAFGMFDTILEAVGSKAMVKAMFSRAKVHI